MVNWTPTVQLVEGLSPVAEALVTLVTSFFPLLLVGAILGMILGIFDSFINSFGRGFRF